MTTATGAATPPYGALGLIPTFARADPKVKPCARINWFHAWGVRSQLEVPSWAVEDR